MLDGVDRVVGVPITNFAAGLSAIRSVPVDVMLDFGQWPRLEALLAFFSKALLTVGFQTSGQFRHYGYDIAVEHSARIHEIENFRRLIRVLGVETTSPPSLRVPPLSCDSLGDYAVFHLWPGGRRKTLKQWPSERWVRLAEQAVDWGLHLVLTGTASDAKNNADIIRRLSPPARKLASNLAGASLGESAAVLKASRLVVSVDTGVMHMAAALGAPLVALHGPSSSKRWGPVSENAIVVESPLPGCGYVSLGWERLKSPPRCMECISYEAVRDACRAIMYRTRSFQIDSRDCCHL